MMTVACLECDVKGNRSDAEFCSNCGASLAENMCSDCEEELAPKDCYCYSCGSKSTFYESGKIKPIESLS